MEPNPSAVWRSAQVRAIDAFAISRLQIPGYELMQRAAAAALTELRRRWSDARVVRVLCGAGNNGGDGYVLARLARQQGLDVRVGAVSDPTLLHGDAARAHADWQAAGGETLPWREVLDTDAVVVDAVLGIGVSRGLRGEFLDAVIAVNERRRRVLALDVPSGLDSDSGLPYGDCVRADCTVTFIAQKPGLWLGRGPDYAGEVVLAELGLARWPDDLGEPLLDVIGQKALSRALPARSRGANKGQFGHVLVIGGGPGMPGAARLSGEAALRSGAGLVTLATAAEHAGQIAASRPELMVSGVTEAAQLMPLLQRADVIAVGPGLGQSAWARSMWSCAMSAGLPMVVDADALNLLAGEPESRATWVLTPHPGEAGRLLSMPTAAVQGDRIAAVTQLQQRYGGVAVLKGAGTLVAGACGNPAALRLTLCTRGNPGMAAPGMGDVLTGIIAALFAQLRDLDTAARLGVFVHALAGDRAAGAGTRGMLATDLIAELRACVNPPAA